MAGRARNLWRLALGLALACATVGLSLTAGAAWSSEVPPAWSQLTPTQQRILEPLHGDWHTFGPDRKRKWLDIAARYPAMSAAQRQTLQDRMRAWSALPPEKRRLARENFLATGRKPLQSRREAWEQYQKLPEAERRKLKEEALNARHRPGKLDAYGKRRAIHPMTGKQIPTHAPSAPLRPRPAAAQSAPAGAPRPAAPNAGCSDPSRCPGR